MNQLNEQLISAILLDTDLSDIDPTEAYVQNNAKLQVITYFVTSNYARSVLPCKHAYLY